MADNWIQSFAVALGFDVDTSSLGTAKKSIADYEAAVKAAEKRIEDARWAGAKTEEEIAKLSRELNLREAKDALAAAQAREKVEKEAAQKREERSKAFIAGVEKMALAATAAATAIGYAFGRVSSAFDHLGFVSARTGASVQSLNSLGYAFKQVGGTSEQAISAVESFTKALRENSGVKGFVQGLGVDMTKDKADQLLDTVRILQGHGYDAGSREAALAGISEENYALLTKYIDEIDRYRAEYNKLTASLGVNSKEATEASMDFQRSLTRLQATASALGDKLLVTLAPALRSIVDRFQDWIRSNPEKVERIMGDISQALVWVAEKIAQMVQTITGNNGEEFIKRWNAFSQSVERFATALEHLVKVGADVASSPLFKILKLLTVDNPLATWPSRLLLGSAEASTGTGASGGGRPGVGAIGGFDPLQSGGSAATAPDDRSWWQRHAPKVLGGKDGPDQPSAPVGSDGTVTVNGHRYRPSAGTEQGKANVSSWLDFAQRPTDKGGLGMPADKARALVAGLQGESTADLNPKSQGDLRDGRPTAFGTAQWRLDRAEGLRRTAAEMGTTWDDIRAQQAWMRKEMLEGRYRGVYDQMMKAPTGESALRSYIDNYENPAKKDLAYDFRKPYLDSLRRSAEGAVAGGDARQVAGNIAPVNGVGGLEQNQGGAEHRRQALSAVLQQQLIAAAKEAGVNVDAFSGGQDPEHQYGSARHNHGNAADVRLYKLAEDGQRRYLDQRNEEDRKVMESFLRSAVKNGATGIGAGPGYMGPEKMHVGGGSVMAWGQGGSSANAPDWVRRALEFGLEDRKHAVAAQSEAIPKQPAARPPVMNPAGFDPNRIDPRDLMKPAAPLGANSVTNSTANDNRAVTQHITTNTTIQGARDTREAGRMMEGTFGRMHSLALENAQSAIA